MQPSDNRVLNEPKVPPRRKQRSARSKTSLNSSSGPHYDRDALAFNHFIGFLKQPLKRHQSSDIAYLIPSMPSVPFDEDRKNHSPESTGNHDRTSYESIIENSYDRINHKIHRQQSFDPSQEDKGRIRNSSNSSVAGDSIGRKATSVGNISPLAISLSTEKLFQHLIVQQSQLEKIRHQRNYLQHQLKLMNSGGVNTATTEASRLRSREVIQQQLHLQQTQLQKHIERLQEQLELVRNVRSSSRTSKDSESRRTFNSYYSDEEKDTSDDEKEDEDEASSTTQIFRSAGNFNDFKKEPEPELELDNDNSRHSSDGRNRRAVSVTPHLLVTNPSTEWNKSREDEMPFIDSDFEADFERESEKCIEDESFGNASDKEQVSAYSEMINKAEKFSLRQQDLDRAEKNIEFQRNILAEQQGIMDEQRKELEKEQRSFQQVRSRQREAESGKSSQRLSFAVSHNLLNKSPSQVTLGKFSTRKQRSDDTLDRRKVLVNGVSISTRASKPDIYLPKITCPITQVSPRLSRPLTPRFYLAQESTSNESRCYSATSISPPIKPRRVSKDQKYLRQVSTPVKRPMSPSLSPQTPNSNLIKRPMLLTTPTYVPPSIKLNSKVLTYQSAYPQNQTARSSSKANLGPAVRPSENFFHQTNEKNSKMGQNFGSYKTLFEPEVSKPFSFFKSTLLGARNLMSSWSDLTRGKQRPKAPPRRRPLSPKPREMIKITGTSNISRTKLSPRNYIQRIFSTPKIELNSSTIALNQSNSNLGPSAIERSETFGSLRQPRIVINEDDSGQMAHLFAQYSPSPNSKNNLSQSFLDLSSYRKALYTDSFSSSVSDKPVDATGKTLDCPDVHLSQSQLSVNLNKSYERRQTMPEIGQMTASQVQNVVNNEASSLLKVFADQRRKHSLSQEKPSNTSLPGWEREKVSVLAHQAREARIKAAQKTTFTYILMGISWILRRKLTVLVVIFNLILAYLFIQLLYGAEEPARRNFPHRKRQ